jgi:hypothetical protein
VKAGREIDALVAEKVFGQKKEDLIYIGRTKYDQKDLRGGYCGSASREIHDRQMGDPESWVHSAVGRWLVEALPHYSTDIAAAMDVLELLRTAYFHVQINVYSDSVNVIIWQDDITPLFDVDAESIPMAISLAALKSKGIDVGKEG